MKTSEMFTELQTDVKWVKESLNNHLAHHETMLATWTRVIVGSLITALVSAGTAIVSLLIALCRAS